MATLVERDEAIAQDVANTIGGTIRLTPHGKTYCVRFASYLLKANGVNNVEAAGAPKRPRCPFSMTLGRMLRAKVYAGVVDQLRNDGRTLQLPVGVMRDAQDRAL